MNDFETLKIIYALLSIGIIKIKDDEDREPQEVTPDEIISKPNVESNEEFIKEVDEMYHKCETREYYRILGVTQQDSALYIKKTYYKIAKKFHPDKHFSNQSKEMALIRFNWACRGHDSKQTKNVDFKYSFLVGLLSVCYCVKFVFSMRK